MRRNTWLIAILSSGLLASCGITKNSDKDSKDQGETAILTEAELSRIQQEFAPLPEVADSTENPVTEAKVELGKKLFLDEALSNPEANGGQRISCNSCHLLDQYGVDGLDRSVGILGEKVPVNAPTVYNAALNAKQFWDGRAATVEEQALGPVTALKEMGYTGDEADVPKIMENLAAADPAYPDLFTAAFPEQGAGAYNFQNVGNAIGAFERTLLTPSRFDDFLKGDIMALNDAEQRGLKVFLNTGDGGCVSCHTGVAVGGGSLMELTGNPGADDTLALAAYEGVPDLVKVPSLRNIEKTGPYFHNGAVSSLDDAIRLMAEYQLGVTLTDTELEDLKAFLGALTGELPPL